MLGFLFSLVFSFFLFLASAEVPNLPPSPCYGGCNAEMEDILKQFETHTHPVQLSPGLYSGECRYLSVDYDPDHTHYSVVMLDRLLSGEIYFSTIFGFFFEPNPFETWSLEQARLEMSPTWKEIGKLTEIENSSRVAVLYPESPPYIYWMRQNPVSGDIYYIAYLGGAYLRAFCRLKSHTQD